MQLHRCSYFRTNLYYISLSGTTTNLAFIGMKMAFL